MSVNSVLRGFASEIFKLLRLLSQHDAPDIQYFEVFIVDNMKMIAIINVHIYNTLHKIHNFKLKINLLATA